MHITPLIRAHSGLHTVLHPTNMPTTMLHLALPPYIAPFRLARMLGAKHAARRNCYFPAMTPRLKTDMLTAKLRITPLGALLVATV